MRSYTRHQLKQNSFAEATKDSMSWAVEHQKNLTIAGVAVVVVAALVFGTWFYIQNREQHANLELGAALRVYEAPLIPAGMPKQGDTLSFETAQQRAKAANGDFTRIADKYSFTASGKLARYFEGITLIDLNNSAEAEKILRDVSSSGKPDLAALAKLALASLYRNGNRDEDAIKIYKDLIDHPTNTVAKPTAQLELASLYQAKQPQEAKKLYEQIQKDNPQTPAAQQAATRLAELK